MLPPDIATMQSLVSVVTPVFNMAQTLLRAYESLQAQSGHWQYIVIDDGSTDDTPRVIEAIAQDSRVLTNRTAKRGIGAALNSALELATGDFVAFLDADDEYMPNHLSSHLTAMAEHPQVDIFWGGLDVIADSPEDALVPDLAAGFGLISIHDCVTQGTLFARRHVFDTVRFAEDRLCWHDYEFIRRVQGQFNIKRFHERTYRYYRNTSASVVDRMKADWPAQRVGGSSAK